MVFLAVVGAVVITTALAIITFWFLYTLHLQAVLSGFGTLSWREWVLIVIISIILIIFWGLWWFWIGAHITIGFA